jgi:XTP/dITP diphosphohydrolase
MKEIVFATNNPHKLKEARNVLEKFGISVISLEDVGIETSIPEDFDTLEENALQKARFIYEKTGKNAMSDDTGLEVNALNGAPGVYSARYAGEHCDASENIKKLLKEMKGISDRTARFRTIIALIWNEKEYLFEGVANGSITLEPTGEKGFGYDPVFIPEGYSKTFAEMTMEEKNTISHRGKALNQLIKFFENPEN